MGREQQRIKRLLAKRRRQKARREHRLTMELPRGAGDDPFILDTGLTLEPDDEAAAVGEPKVSEVLARFAEPWTDDLGEDATPAGMRMVLELAAKVWNRLVLDEGGAARFPIATPTRDELQREMVKYLGLSPQDAADELAYMDGRRRREAACAGDFIMPRVDVHQVGPGQFHVSAMRLGL